MRRRLSTIVGALILSGLVAPASEAQAFKCSRVGQDFGPSLLWNQRVIPWYASSALTDDIADHAAALAEVQGSYRAWEDVDCSDIQLPFMGEEPGLVAGFTAEGPNRNVVLFIESGWPYDPGVIAVTTNAFDTRSGVVIDSDVEINGQQFHFVIVDDSCDARTGNMDLRNALTHEVGHLLGLDHPPNTQRNADSTMFASAPPCETKKRSLAQDDIDGICSIYPGGMPNQQCFPPDGPSFVPVESDNGFGGCSDVLVPSQEGQRRSRARTSCALAVLGIAIGARALRRRPPKRPRS